MTVQLFQASCSLFFFGKEREKTNLILRGPNPTKASLLIYTIPEISYVVVRSGLHRRKTIG